MFNGLDALQLHIHSLPKEALADGRKKRQLVFREILIGASIGVEKEFWDRPMPVSLCWHVSRLVKCLLSSEMCVS
jgi:hypothetical protein